MTQKNLAKLTTMALMFYAVTGVAQTDQYKRPEAKPKAAAGKGAGKSAAQPVKKEAPKGDKLDIKDLEQKYWAPKDTDFSVVQNRTYAKEKKFVLTAGVGFLINDSFSEGESYGLTGNYFFSERSGVQFDIYRVSSRDNDTTRAFTSEQAVSDAGIQPNHGKVKGFYDVGYTWVPFYGKVSLLGRRIIYMDLALTPTIGLLEYEQQLDDGNEKQTAFAFGLDVTQYFFIAEGFAVRADLRNKWYSEDVRNYQDGSSVTNQLTHDLQITFGVTYYFDLF